MLFFPFLLISSVVSIPEYTPQYHIIVVSSYVSRNDVLFDSKEMCQECLFRFLSDTKKNIRKESKKIFFYVIKCMFCWHFRFFGLFFVIWTEDKEKWKRWDKNCWFGNKNGKRKYHMCALCEPAWMRWLRQIRFFLQCLNCIRELAIHWIQPTSNSLKKDGKIEMIRYLMLTKKPVIMTKMLLLLVVVVLLWRFCND